MARPSTSALAAKLGAKAGVPRGRALALATAYVVGIATMFGTLGTTFGLLGRAFGTFLANPWVIVPLALPGLAAAASFAVLMSYNEVFAASILTIERPTLPALVLNALSASPDPYKFAAAWLLMVPTFVFIFIMRRYILGFGVERRL